MKFFVVEYLVPLGTQPGTTGVLWTLKRFSTEQSAMTFAFLRNGVVYAVDIPERYSDEPIWRLNWRDFQGEDGNARLRSFGDSLRDRQLETADIIGVL